MERKALPTTPIDSDHKHETAAYHRAGGEYGEDASCQAESSSAQAKVADAGKGLWWAGVLVGAIIASPLTWLLSHAATLPFFIGIFFFALFGLVIGASIHRVAARRAPYSRAPVIGGTTLIVLLCWGGSVYLESTRFPVDVATFAIETTRDIGDRTANEFRADVADNTRRFLREKYPPGGLLGYARWSLLNSRLTRQDVPGLRKPFRSDQAKIWWAVRIVLCIGLLAFGVSSQTLPLGKTRDTTVTNTPDSRPSGGGAIDHASQA